MVCPPVVRRAFVRLLVGWLVAAVVAGAGAWAWASRRVGATPDDTRRLVEADVRARMARLTGALDDAVQTLPLDAALVEQASAGDGPSIGRLFSVVTLQGPPAERDVTAMTIHGADGTPLAWDGRPSTLPAARLSGPAVTFLLPTPLGLRLARLEPIVTGDGNRRRVGAIVAEAAVSTDLGAPGGESAWPTGIASVTLGPPVPHEDDPHVFDLTAADGARLGTARIAPESLVIAYHREWGRLAATLWLVAAAGLAIAWGPLALWRRIATTRATYLTLGLVMAGGAAVAWWAMARAVSGFGSATREFQFLAAGMAALALAALSGSTVARWLAVGGGRFGWRSRRRAGLVVVHVVAGALVAVAAARHQAFVAALVAEAGSDVTRFSRTPFEAARLGVASGVIVWHAAVALVAAAIARAIVAAGATHRQAFGRLGILGAALGVVAAARLAGRDSAVNTIVLSAGVLLLAAWFDTGARTLRRGSQAARLFVLLAIVIVPAVAAHPSLSDWAARAQRDRIERELGRQVADHRQSLQLALQDAQNQIWSSDIAELLRATPPAAGGPVPTDAAFLLWSRTSLAERRLTSSVELYDASGRLVGRFGLNLPETAVDQAWQEASCDWQIFEEVSPFFAEERQLLHAGRAVCEDGRIVGSVVVHVVFDYANLPFLAAQNPTTVLLGGGRTPADTLDDDIAFVVYGWSRRPLYVAGGDAWTLPEPLLDRLVESREPFWTTLELQGVTSDVYVLSDRGAIYAIGAPRASALAYLSDLAEVVALAGLLFVALLVAVTLLARAGGHAPVSGRALFREVRASFSRTLFLAFVAAVVVPVVALALVTRAYIATSLREDIEREATRTVLSASRVIEDFGAIESRGGSNLPALDDSLLVWLSRVVGEDINVFAGTGLLASSERTLFASGLLPTRTPGATYRALVIDGQPTALSRETVGTYEYYVASAQVRVGDRPAIVSVPLTLRQRGIERQVDELDRRVLLAAIAFILLGCGIGFWAAERISDPVNRLTRATRRLAAGDLNARVLVRTSDELGRLVAAFNSMADDLLRQRVQLERTNRLEAWAEMARQVAHDIKNPLTPVQLNAEHLRRVHEDRGRPLGAVVDDCVNHILLQVRLLRQLASEFSSFASAPQPRPEVTPLAPLLDEILSPYVGALGGRIAIETTGAAGVSLYVDRVLLARALTNVIENALHAMPGEGRLTVAATNAGGRVCLEVTDTGVGMDAQALARIFEPYFSTKATGTGLGLTIARRNVELNGGTIEVRSTPGRGTTVTLCVPAVAPVTAPLSEVGV
jgi:signal transduction histidine kinase